MVEVHFPTAPIPSTTTDCNGVLTVVDESEQVAKEHDLYLEFAKDLDFSCMKNPEFGIGFCFFSFLPRGCRL